MDRTSKHAASIGILGYNLCFGGDYGNTYRELVKGGGASACHILHLVYSQVLVDSTSAWKRRVLSTACVEIDDDCWRTLQANTKRMRWGNKVRFFRDINEITANDLLQAAKLLPGEAYLLAGGPPCQSFSTAGNRQSIRDPRGSLLYKYVEMVRDTRPRFLSLRMFAEFFLQLLSMALEEKGPSYPPLEPEEELGSF